MTFEIIAIKGGSSLTYQPSYAVLIIQRIFSSLPHKRFGPFIGKTMKIGKIND